MNFSKFLIGINKQFMGFYKWMKLYNEIHSYNCLTVPDMFVIGKLQKDLFYISKGILSADSRVNYTVRYKFCYREGYGRFVVVDDPTGSYLFQGYRDWADTKGSKQEAIDSLPKKVIVCEHVS